MNKSVFCRFSKFSKFGKFGKLMILCFVLTAQLNVAHMTGASSASSGVFGHNPNIRVGLVFGGGATASFRTTAPNGFIIGEVRADEPYVFYAQRFIANTSIAVTRRGDGLAVINTANNAVLHEYTHASNNLAIIAAHPSSGGEFPLRFDELSSRTTGFMTTSVNNIYSGAFIYRPRGARLEVIALVCLEDYLKGVVPNEVSPNWEPEALRAFTVAARSFSVHSILRSRHAAEGFDLCNTSHCQLFIGSRNATDRTNAAVTDTRGLVATFEGRVIEAVYHSSSGGVTENHNDAWGGEMRYPFLSSVRLPFENYRDPGRRNALWTNRVSPRELFDYLVNQSPQSALFRNRLNAPIADIRINARSPGSNFIRSVSVIDTNGNTVTVETSARIRSAFARFANSANMDIYRPSSFRAYLMPADSGAAAQSIETGRTYVMAADGLRRVASSELAVMAADGLLRTVQAYAVGTDFIFDGRGWGHGVGMSQWGAQDMALLGYGFEQIVKTFYTGVSIQRLTEMDR